MQQIKHGDLQRHRAIMTRDHTSKIQTENQRNLIQSPVASLLHVSERVEELHNERAKNLERLYQRSDVLIG